MDKSTSKSVELVAFEPEEWSTMNQHQKIDSIWWDTDGAQLKNLAIEPYVNTEDDNNDVLLEKIKAAKFAFKHVFKKMNVARQAYVNYQRPDSEDEDEDHHSVPDYYGYTEEELLKFVSALRFNYPFELCFEVKADIKHEFDCCICSCSINNKRWREKFDIDCVRDHEKCKKKKNEKYTIDSILQHLRSKHNTGYSYFHSISYFYIMKLYSSIIPSTFLEDLPKEVEIDNSESQETSNTRKRKQESSDAGSSDAACSSRQTKMSKKASSSISSYPPSSIVYPEVTKAADSSSISTVTTSATKTSHPPATSLPVIKSPEASNPTSSSATGKAATSSSVIGSNLLRDTSSSAGGAGVAIGSSLIRDTSSSAGGAGVAVGSRNFHVTRSNRTRVVGDITIIYHDNKLKDPKVEGLKKSTKRNIAKNLRNISHRLDLKDFVHKRRNKEPFTKKTIYIIDTSSEPMSNCALGKICYGYARCFGWKGWAYKKNMQGEPDEKFEWLLKLANHPADLYMSNERMKDIAGRDGSSDNPYFSLFIGNGIFQTER